jgi:quercetin dioxygenase-like cupin family protein
MINRRVIFNSLLASPAAALLSLYANAAGTSDRAETKPVLQQDLPEIDLKNWQVTAVEVRYEPGQASAAHRHPGFVLGYVIEGSVRFALRGQPERIVEAGQMFYEPPGSVHQVSSNASNEKPARLLAMIIAERGETLTRPA